MTAKTKIDVHVGTLSMKFGDTLVQFNIFEALKHPTEDHSLFGIDLIDELVGECLQLDSINEDILDFVGDTKSFDSLGYVTEEADYDELWEVHNLSDSEDDNIDLANLSQELELPKLVDQVYKHEDQECSNNAEQPKAKSISDEQVQNRVPSGSDANASKYAESESNLMKVDSILVNRSHSQKHKAEIMSAHLVSNPSQVGQQDLKTINDNSSSLPPPIELKSLPSHLKYAYNFNGGRSQAHKAIAKKDEFDHSRRGQERGDKTTCYRDYLPHLRQLVG
ncbi:hypothetical protein CR513_27392, partial [Mucuna pruriens]